jgi:membrane protein implicated in regulation of membrane protease activity
MRPGIHISVFLVTAMLLLYIILISIDVPLRITGLLFSISPLFLTWMVVSVLKSKTNNTKDLAEGEEWGYADKKKEDLNMF